jgi:hypothetical protein
MNDAHEVTPEGYRDRTPRRLEKLVSGRRLKWPWRAAAGPGLALATPAPADVVVRAAPSRLPPTTTYDAPGTGSSRPVRFSMQD